MTDVLIVGAGPCGLTAAIYAIRYGLSVTVFERLVSGGQVATTPEVENYPGFEKITGYEFSLSLQKQAIDIGVLIKMETVVMAELSGTVKKIVTEQGIYEGKTVIFANGATRGKLGCDGEVEFAGKGVSYCATCDGFFFRNKVVAVVGGGNTALEDALLLSNICKKVYLIHRKNEFSGLQTLQELVKNNAKIEIIYDSFVEKIKGDKNVSSIVIANKSNEKTVVETDAIFVAIGTRPDNQLFKGELTLDAAGYIKAAEDCLTNVKGVFAGGDTRTKPFRQIVTATGDGAVCALMAANYIAF